MRKKAKGQSGKRKSGKAETRQGREISKLKIQNSRKDQSSNAKAEG
jgi:hypothetical protein